MANGLMEQLMPKDGKINVYTKGGKVNVCVFHTLIFILNSVVDRVDSFLQLIPGEQIFAHPLPHIKQKVKIPDERTIRVSFSL